MKAKVLMPETLNEALNMLQQFDRGISAGGAGLLVELMSKNGEGSIFIDINNIEELKGIDTGKGTIKIGFAKLWKANIPSTAAITCAVKLDVSEDSITAAAIYTGSLGNKACREHGTERYLTGKLISKEDEYLDKAAVILSKEIEERQPVSTSMIYKRAAVKGLFKEAFHSAVIISDRALSNKG